jgi:hypothetical protein
MVYMVTGNSHFMKHLTPVKQCSIVCMLAISSSFIATTAQAGWFNDMFIYREEQMPLIDPNNVQTPPVEVISPYYSKRKAGRWSHHHTRQNMAPVPYIDGSASLVMRPQSRPRDNRDMQAWPGNMKMNPNQGGRLPQGYEAILWRDYVNRMQNERKRTFIGEPGFADKLPYNEGASIGQKTQIGNPVKSWKDAPTKNTGATPRPGDFDYQKEASNRYTAPQTNTMIDAPKAPAQPTAPQRAPVPAQSSGLYQGDMPSRYIVEDGDSLSGISEKDRIYGNWKMWPLIYDANRNQIKDPDLIYPEQDLGIPRDYTPQDSMNAQQRALDKKPPYLFYDGK